MYAHCQCLDHRGGPSSLTAAAKPVAECDEWAHGLQGAYRRVAGVIFLNAGAAGAPRRAARVFGAGDGMSSAGAGECSGGRPLGASGRQAGSSGAVSSGRYWLNTWRSTASRPLVRSARSRISCGVAISCPAAPRRETRASSDRKRLSMRIGVSIYIDSWSRETDTTVQGAPGVRV